MKAATGNAVAVRIPAVCCIDAWKVTFEGGYSCRVYCYSADNWSFADLSPKAIRAATAAILKLDGDVSADEVGEDVT